jgi:hypothetical protein
MKEVCSPINSGKRPSPKVDVHRALRSTNPKHASPYCRQGPKAPASTKPLETPMSR